AADGRCRPHVGDRTRQAALPRLAGAGTAPGDERDVDDGCTGGAGSRWFVRSVREPDSRHLPRPRRSRPGLCRRPLAGPDGGAGMRRALLVVGLAVVVGVPVAVAAGSQPPNDPYLSRQWYIGRDRALDTFDVAKQLFTVRVAVIDSGVEANHPELKGRIVAAKSFVGGAPRSASFGQGTFVAGEIAAIAGNGAGIAGLAPPARLLVAKVVRDDGSIPPKAEAKAIRWAVAMRARVINLSLGSTRDPGDPSVDGYSAVEKHAIEFAVRRGVLVVAAAGNGDDAPTKPWPFASYPPADPHALAV